MKKFPVMVFLSYLPPEKKQLIIYVKNNLMLTRIYEEQWPTAIHIFMKQNISTTVGDNMSISGSFYHVIKL